jgi:uncharacterized protein YbjT (DUF2867 family)
VNLVVGATGVLGTEICRLLAAENEPVRGLVRKSALDTKRDALQQMGVELAEGDLRDRESLASACRNVTNIVSTATSIVSRQPGDSFEVTDRDGHLQLIEEAEKANVRKFVFISFASKPLEFPLKSAKKEVEERLKRSKLIYTILQPTVFQEVWLGPHLGFDAINAKARIYGPGEKRNSWISFRDVAKFTVASLKNPYAENNVIPLGGPEALSPLEVVKIFEEVKGKKMELEFVPLEVLKAQYEAAQDPTQKTFAALMIAYAEGTEIPMKEVLEKMPAKLQSVREYLMNAL